MAASTAFASVASVVVASWPWEASSTADLAWLGPEAPSLDRLPLTFASAWAAKICPSPGDTVP